MGEYAETEDAITQKFNALSKKNTYDDVELHLYLEDYIRFLGRIHVVDTFSHFTLNFVKAAVIIENSCKVYCGKVDRLQILEEILLETLITKDDGKKKRREIAGEDLSDGEAPEEENAPGHVAAPVRRRRQLKDVIAEEDFFEIDNRSGLLGKSDNDSEAIGDCKLRFLERKINLFTKNKQERKRINVCLKKVEEKDESRLRDWVLNVDMMIVRELFSSSGMSPELRFGDLVDEEEHTEGEHLTGIDDDWQQPLTPAPSESSDVFSSSASEASIRVANFRCDNDCLADASEDKEDIIESKKLNPGITTRPMCDVCHQEKIYKKGCKNCKKKGKATEPLEPLDEYFYPHVQPTVSDPQHGLLPDQELFALYKNQMKAVEHLKRRNAKDYLAEGGNHLKGAEFAGFEEEDDELRGNCDVSDMLGEPNGFELPLPVVDNQYSSIPDDVRSVGSNHLVEELKEIASAHSRFEQNKNLAVKIAAWHNSLADKIALSEQRGALNMDVTASRIMSAFPQESSGTSTKPQMSFKNLMELKTRRDVPRYFLACLQLTNEGNIDIVKPSSKKMATDGMLLVRLRTTRVKELDEYQTHDTEPRPSTSGGTKRSHDGEESAPGRKKARDVPSKRTIKRKNDRSPGEVPHKL